jgi:hypothetical protein
MRSWAARSAVQRHKGNFRSLKHGTPISGGPKKGEQTSSVTGFALSLGHAGIIVGKSPVRNGGHRRSNPSRSIRPRTVAPYISDRSAPPLKRDGVVGRTAIPSRGFLLAVIRDSKGRVSRERERNKGCSRAQRGPTGHLLIRLVHSGSRFSSMNPCENRGKITAFKK